MKYQIVSHHMLRRRARALRAKLRDAQRDVRAYVMPAGEPDPAQELLSRYDVEPTDSLHVEKAQRGPWRWYVVAG